MVLVRRTVILGLIAAAAVVAVTVAWRADSATPATATQPAQPEEPAVQASTEPPLSDRFGDGTPDFLRLRNPSDRRTFLRWFTFLAELQYYRDPQRLPKEINDCAALLRYAYREALRDHSGSWASDLGLESILQEGSVRQYRYPYTLLGANLFRVRPGAFEPDQLKSAAFAQFADAKTLQLYNTFFVSRSIEEAQPGDLLFYLQLQQDMPFHAMVYLGRSQFEPEGDWLVYHTGPIDGGPGEIRRRTVEELHQHPSPRWHPVPGNGNFLGVYRWNILREAD